MLYYENKARKEGFQIVIGVDEAGRGPLAGPVVASAVCLKKKRFRNKICDSKKISPRQREKAFHEIFENAYVGVGVMSESVIDSLNILKATHAAMAIAVNNLVLRLSPSATGRKNFWKKVCVLIDGNSIPADLPYASKAIIRGDNLSMSIACASIVAKVLRDRMLEAYDKVFPQYGFKKHKGYPTAFHRRAIGQHGLSLIHRKTFHLKDVVRKD